MKGIGKGMYEYVKMYDAIQFCVNWGCDEMTQVVVKETFVRQGWSLNSYIFDMFMDDIIDYTGEGNACPLVGEKPTIPGLHFTDDLAMGCSKSILQHVNLNCNLRESK
jgi:hypothetical protein